MRNGIRRLNRFDTLPALLDIIKHKRLALLSPAEWEDKNDAKILLEYQNFKKISLLALCFTWKGETIHHWNTFAKDSSGCCIEFDAKELIRTLRKHPNLRYGRVKYRKLNDIHNDKIEIEHIPFTKRWPYRCESEYRIIWEGKSTRTCEYIPIDLEMITKVTMSQRMPDPLYETTREILHEVCKDFNIRINHSTLTMNSRWVGRFTKACNPIPFPPKQRRGKIPPLKHTP